VRFLLPLLACLLSATPHWVKPEASKSDLAEDQAACVQAIQQPSSLRADMIFGRDKHHVTEIYRSEMGWHLLTSH
jgi:hypothetical protein